MFNSNYLKRSRIEKGYNSTGLAKELGVYRSNVTLWEQGKRFPRMEMIIRLCKLLDMDANILLNLKGEYE